MACCDTHDEIADELTELALDPTLQDCCRRDLKEQAYVERVKSKLLAVDRVDQRTNLARGVIKQVRSREKSQLGIHDQSDSDLSETDDADLDEYRRLRLQQLQNDARQKAERRKLGLGSLTSVSETTLMESIQNNSDECIVGHLAIPGYEVGCEVDEHLEALAHQYPYTRFLRSDYYKGSRLQANFDIPWVDVIMGFRDGCIVGRWPVDGFVQNSSLQEEKISSCLRKAGLLRQDRNPGSNDTSHNKEGNDSAGGSSENEEEDWKRPCDICGRKYFHEHIRSVHQGNVGREKDASSEDE
eukprot:jgi/Botrbrau1/22333/Bobra.0002s0012.1